MIRNDPLFHIVSEETRQLLFELERLPLDRRLLDRIKTLRADLDEVLERQRQD
jgi:hypothetical protein